MARVSEGEQRERGVECDYDWVLLRDVLSACAAAAGGGGGALMSLCLKSKRPSPRCGRLGHTTLLTSADVVTLCRELHLQYNDFEGGLPPYYLGYEQLTCVRRARFDAMTVEWPRGDICGVNAFHDFCVMAARVYVRFLCSRVCLTGNAKFSLEHVSYYTVRSAFRSFVVLLCTVSVAVSCMRYRLALRLLHAAEPQLRRRCDGGGAAGLAAVLSGMLQPCAVNDPCAYPCSLRPARLNTP
jgi:hypothetical protein